MKKNVLKRYVAWAVLAAAWGATAGSCIKDEVSPMGETTLTLTFSTRADNPVNADGTIGPETANEHMRTLRVILTEADGTIRYNTKIDNIPEEDKEEVITYRELITASEGAKDFTVYAIANEESIAGTDFGYEQGTMLPNEFLEKALSTSNLEALNNSIGLTSADDEIKYLPQTKVETVQVKPNQDNTASIQLEFVVAKVSMQITNQSLRPITLPLTFTKMNVPTTTLFASSPLPEGRDLVKPIVVAGNETQDISFYVYESQLPENGSYVLRSDWGNNSNLNLSTVLEQAFMRGTKLQIKLTLDAAQQVDNLELLVLPWGEIDVTVPPYF